MHMPQEAEIRDRAYALWQEAGAPDGRDQEYWYSAERELAEAADRDSMEDDADQSQPIPPAGFVAH